MDNQSTTTDTATYEQVTTTGDKIVLDAPHESVATTLVRTERDDEGKVNSALVGFEKMSWYGRTADVPPAKTALLRISRKQMVDFIQRLLRTFFEWRREGYFTEGYGDVINMPIRANRMRWDREDYRTDEVSARYDGRDERSVRLGGLRFVMNVDTFELLKREINDVTVPKSVIPLDSIVTINRSWTAYHTYEIDDVEDVLDGVDYEVVVNENGERFAVLNGTEREVSDLFTDALYESMENYGTPERTYEFDEFEEQDSDIDGDTEAYEYDPEEHGEIEEE